MHPLFARVERRLRVAQQELDRMLQSMTWLQQQPEQDAPPAAYARVQVVAGGVESVYSGLESLLELVAVEVDKDVPKGGDYHAEIIQPVSVFACCWIRRSLRRRPQIDRRADSTIRRQCTPARPASCVPDTDSPVRVHHLVKCNVLYNVVE